MDKENETSGVKKVKSGGEKKVKRRGKGKKEVKEIPKSTRKLRSHTGNAQMLLYGYPLLP
jgi:hypothetical protein